MNAPNWVGCSDDWTVKIIDFGMATEISERWTEDWTYDLYTLQNLQSQLWTLTENCEVSECEKSLETAVKGAMSFGGYNNRRTYTEVFRDMNAINKVFNN